MELHSVAQVKDEGDWIGLVPTDGQCGSELEGGIVIDQSIEEKRINSLRLCVCPDARIEICRAALDEEDDCLWIARRGMAASQGQYGGQEKNSTHRSPGPGSWAAWPL